jgi:hypothetical protein
VKPLSYYELNLKFISLGSDVHVIPKEHSFLKKYFKTKVQRAFLFYYYYFREKCNFQDHTGYRATDSFLSKLASKFEWILGEYNTARKNLDFQKVGEIQRRRLKLIKKLL